MQQSYQERFNARLYEPGRLARLSSRLPERARMWSPWWLRHVVAVERTGHAHTMAEYAPIEDALHSTLVCIDLHERWCGHNPDAPGDSIIHEAPRKARAALGHTEAGGRAVDRATTTPRTCPHCDGTGCGPQHGAWGAALTSAGVLPADCQNCDGSGVIHVAQCSACDGHYVPRAEAQVLCTACSMLDGLEGHRVVR